VWRGVCGEGGVWRGGWGEEGEREREVVVPSLCSLCGKQSNIIILSPAFYVYFATAHHLTSFEREGLGFSP
jgi:hypothetical protein